jgi:hypothetical protein
VSRTRAGQIERLERDGVMAARRGQPREWFQAHPRGTPEQAVRELRYTHADHMYAVADSVRVDLLREQSADGDRDKPWEVRQRRLAAADLGRPLRG